MIFNWVELIALFTFLQLLLLTVVSFNYKKGKRLSNRLLAGFMISNVLLIAHFLMRRFGWISMEKWTVIYSLGNSAYLFLMPFLYLYIRSLCYKDFNLKMIHLLHAIPFTILVLFSLLVHFMNHIVVRSVVFISIQQHIGHVEYWSHKAAMHLQILSYLVASISVLTAYRKRLRDLYSSVEKIDLIWCNVLLVGFSAMWFLDLLNWILSITNVSSNIVSHRMLISSLLINLTFTLVVTYKGLAQSVSFSGIRELPKYAASRLKPSDCKKIVAKLTALIKNEKPYLFPSLSAEDLSKALKVPVKNLSQTMHTCMNQNFYDFINGYRIEDVKKRIRDKRFRNLTLLALAYDAGFNSKSVFNAAFKKHTGMTPKEYKRRYSA
jgi:AraC-like DNA-binding protein